MPKLSPKAIIVGGVVDVGASIVLGIPLVFYVLSQSGISSGAGANAGTSVVAAIHDSPTLRSVQLLIGAACSILGGYVAARIAPRDRFVNALLASWLCVGLGVYSIAPGRSGQPLWESLLLLLSTLACYALGGYLRVRASSASSAPA